MEIKEISEWQQYGDGQGNNKQQKSEQKWNGTINFRTFTM